MEADSRRRVASITAGCAAAALILLATGCASSGRTPERKGLENDPAYHLRWAIEQYQRGRYKEALESADRAIALKPDGYDLYNMRGLIYHAAGQPEQALADFHKALEVNPYCTDAHNNLGVVLADTGRREEALAEFAIVLRDPKYQFREKAHLNIGDVRAADGKLEEAVQEYRQAIIIKPDYVRAHYKLGLALQSLGRADEARHSFDEVLRLAPQSNEAREVKGILQHGTSPS